MEGGGKGKRRKGKREQERENIKMGVEGLKGVEEGKGT